MGDDSGSGFALSLDAAVAERDWDTVMATMNRDWAGLLSAHPAALASALEALPGDVLQANPRWAMARTYVSRITRGDAATATRYRHAALPDHPVALMDTLAELTSRSASRRAAGQFATAAELAGRARDLLSTVDDDGLREVQPGLPEFHQQWGMSKEFAGDSAGAIADYTDAYDHAVLGRHPIIQLNAAGSLAWLHVLAGRGAQASAWLDRLPAAADDAWWATRYSVPAQLARAYRLIDELRFDEARRYLADEVDVGHYPEYWAAKPLLQSLVVREKEEAVALLVALDSKNSGVPEELMSRGTSGGLYRLARSALLARAGTLTDAVGELDAAEADVTTVVGRLVLAAHSCLDLLTRQYASAIRATDRLRAEATDNPRVLATALAVSAVAAMRDNDRPRAISHLRAAAAIATDHRVLSAFVAFSRTDLRDLLALDPGALPADVAERVFATGRTPMHIDGFSRLTPREIVVIRAVLATPTVAAAAAALYVSVNTVKSQLRSIYAKLDVSTRQQLRLEVTRRATAKSEDEIRNSTTPRFSASHKLSSAGHAPRQSGSQ